MDDVGATCSTLGNLFSSKTFTWANSILDTSIPSAAVRSVAESGLSVQSLFGALDNGPKQALDADSASAETRTLRSLFEQAVNAGMVVPNKPATQGEGLASGYERLQLSVDDTITFYVKYNMTKTRR